MMANPWLVAPNGSVLPIQEGNELSGVYLESREVNVTKEYAHPTVHDFQLDADDDTEAKQIVVWGGWQLTQKLEGCVKGERVHLRYLGAYPSEYGFTIYRWQLWREQSHQTE